MRCTRPALRTSMQELELEELRPRHGVVPVRLDRAEPEGLVERDRLGHGRQRVEAHPRVAHFPRDLDDRRDRQAVSDINAILGPPQGRVLARLAFRLSNAFWTADAEVNAETIAAAKSRATFTSADMDFAGLMGTPKKKAGRQAPVLVSPAVTAVPPTFPDTASYYLRSSR